MSDEWGDPVESKQINRWKPSAIGDSIIGQVTELIDGKYGKEAKLKQEDGSLITTPGHAYLKGLIENLKIGQRVKITVTGAKKGAKGGTGWLYEVRPSKNQTLPPTSEEKPPQEPVDASTQLLRMVANSTVGINDVDFWKNAQVLTGGNLSGAMSMVQHLKEKGELFQDKDGFWKVGK